MKSLVCRQPLDFVMTDCPRPAPAPGEVLVRIRRVGICGTDLHAYQGKQPFFTYPRVLGHELSGEVAELGQGAAGFTVGDKVLVIPYIHCGTCIACRRGITNACASLSVMGVHRDGGMCEYLSVPAAHLIAVKKLSWDELALVECLAIGAHAVRRAAPEAGETALVIGTGPIGFSCLQLLKARGLKIMCVDLDQARLDFCQGTLGATGFLPGADLAQRLCAANGGDLPTLVIDATGHAGSMSGSWQYCAQGGRLVFVGLTRDELRFVHPDIHRRELSIHCSRGATRADFDPVIRGLEEGTIQSSCMITHRCTLDELPAIFPNYFKPGSGLIKAMVEV